MAVAQVHELAGMTKDLYEQAMQELNLPGPPPGPNVAKLLSTARYQHASASV